jgi:hypothetical protein
MALTWVAPDRVGAVTGLRVSLNVAVCWGKGFGSDVSRRLPGIIV